MTPTQRRVAAAIISAAVSAATVTGCATTFDASLATDPAATTTSSTLPVGDATELLPKLAAEARGLAALMIAGDDAAGSAQRIQELWDAVKVEVDTARPELLSDFSRNVARCQTAVRYKRAADADKAGRNLTTLVDAFLG